MLSQPLNDSIMEKKVKYLKKGNQISCVCVEEGHKYSPFRKQRGKKSWLLKHIREKCIGRAYVEFTTSLNVHARLIVFNPLKSRKQLNQKEGGH